MLEHALGRFSDHIFEYVTNLRNSRRGLLVKKHSEHLDRLGDYSFPNTIQSWINVLETSQISTDSGNNLMKAINKTPEDLVEQSKNWELPVKTGKQVKDRIHVFLSRPISIKVGVIEGLRNNDIILQRLLEVPSSVQLDPLCEDEKCLTYLRLKHLTKAIQNLCAIHAKCTDSALKVLVTTKSSSKREDSFIILCGTVLNATSGVKESIITSDNFVELRQNEMTLIAQHKYGVRVATESKWKDFIAHLGESAVIFELLQTKPSGAVKINFDHFAGSSKGASFILYNCARLETLIRTFNAKVEEGIYPPLPHIDSADFTLLTQEEEWTLVFNFILGLPLLLENCVEINEKSCEFRPHHICSFLSSMVRVFSQYYRKTRVLTEARKHLLPIMFARIHMLKVLNNTLKTCLRILNIKSVTQM